MQFKKSAAAEDDSINNSQVALKDEKIKPKKHLKPIL